MAEKTFNTRLTLKYDSYANWSLNNPVLLAGEVAIATIPAATGPVKQAPATLFKVGDGTTHYNDLQFVSGLAANVSSWALASEKPVYSASEIDGLADFIGGEIENTNTTYQIVKVDEYNYKLQSKELGATDWVDVPAGAISIPKYDDTAVKADITALQGLVGEVAVATQIANAIAALDLENTYEVKGAASSALEAAKGYTDTLANGAVKTNTDAIAAIKDGTTLDSFADVETALAGKEAAGAAAQALADAKTYADGKDAAIAAAKSAADAAQGEVDALELLVGTPTEGKTVVEMIADAQDAATYDDTQVKADIKANADAIDAIEADYLKAADKTELQGQITTNTEAIATLNGTGDGSVKKQVSDAIAGVVASAPEDFDTLKEIADYIASDKTGAAELSNKVAANTAAIGKASEGETPATGLHADIEAVEGRMTTAEGEIDALQADSHTHDNKALLDTYTQTEADLADAVSKKHSHANAAVLDGITAAQVTNWDKTVTDLATLDGKVGAVTEGKTVVEMIADAQAAATYDDTAVRGLISDNTDAISAVEGRVGTLETNAVLTGDTLILNCGNSVI